MNYQLDGWLENGTTCNSRPNYTPTLDNTPTKKRTSIEERMDKRTRGSRRVKGSRSQLYLHSLVRSPLCILCQTIICIPDATKGLLYPPITYYGGLEWSARVPLLLISPVIISPGKHRFWIFILNFRICLCIIQKHWHKNNVKLSSREYIQITENSLNPILFFIKIFF